MTEKEIKAAIAGAKSTAAIDEAKFCISGLARDRARGLNSYLRACCDPELAAKLAELNQADLECVRKWIDVAMARSANVAAEGDLRWHEALCKVAASLTMEEKPLPLWLQKYVVCVAQKGAPKRKRGPDRLSSWDRDFAIASTVHIIARRFGLHYTRNLYARGKECGCSIVAKALDLDWEMSEANVVAIWRREKVWMLKCEHLRQWPERISWAGLRDVLSSRTSADLADIERWLLEAPRSVTPAQ